MKTLRKQSRKMMLSESFFSVMKTNNREAFDYYVVAGSGIVSDGYIKTLDEIEELKLIVQNIYFKRKDDRTLNDLLNKLIPKYYSTLNSSYSLFRRIWNVSEKNTRLLHKLKLYKDVIRIDKELNEVEKKKLKLYK